MKLLLSHLIGSTVSSRNGPCGILRDFYFDDHHWVLRYLVCQLTPGRTSVLIPSGHFLRRDWDLPLFPVDLTLGEVKDCPRPESDRPVSQQKQRALGSLIHWPEMGAFGTPGFLMTLPTGSTPAGDPHLRSYQVVRRYTVDSSWGALGRVKDFVIDDADWSIHGLLVKLAPWYRPKTVMVSPQWARRIDWLEGSIWTDARPADWQTAPTFTAR